MQFSTDEHEARRQKREVLVTEGGVYPAESNRTHTTENFFEQFDELEQQQTSLTLAGRVRSQRVHGGSAFLTISDQFGSVQLFFSKQEVGEDAYLHMKQLVDVGDIVEVAGYAFVTKKGEKSLFVQKWCMLSKALLSLPEKWHGLSDVETRFRKRYLDILMNDDVRARMVKRTRIISTIREVCDAFGMLEVETPTLQPLYGGGFAKPFKTHHNALDADFYLRISDEMYLKRLLVGSFDAVYEITKVFRNEGIDRDHNPEFTMFEAQVAYKDYQWGMDFFEELYETCAKNVCGGVDIEHGEHTLSFARPWKRMRLIDSIKEVGGVDASAWSTVDEAKDALRPLLEDRKQDELSHMLTLGEVIAFAFEELVEEKLIQPTLIYDYPVEVSPLAKKCEDERFTQRFEAFCLGMEIGNNYSELNDPVELEERFIEEKKKEDAGFDEAHQTDYDYITAIKHGMPPACGLGIGIDRMVMVLTGADNIKEVILFPTLKPKHE